MFPPKNQLGQLAQTLVPSQGTKKPRADFHPSNSASQSFVFSTATLVNRGRLSTPFFGGLNLVQKNVQDHRGNRKATQEYFSLFFTFFSDPKNDPQPKPKRHSKAVDKESYRRLPACGCP